jgi:hypothetical protein
MKGSSTPAAAELGPRLDHLGQAHRRTLVGVEGHEEGSEPHSEDDREDGPSQAQSHRRAGESDDEGGQDEVAGEPEGALVPDLSMAFGQGNRIDRSGFDDGGGLVRGQL